MGRFASADAGDLFALRVFRRGSFRRVSYRAVKGWLAIPTVIKTITKPNINPICISNMVRSSSQGQTSNGLVGEDILSGLSKMLGRYPAFERALS